MLSWIKLRAWGYWRPRKPCVITQHDFSLPLMKSVLLIVFAGVLAASSAAAQPTVAALDASKLRLASANALILDAEAGQAIYSKAADEVASIASLTKLMTAMVTLDANLPM